MKSILSQLRVKYAEKTWNETFLLVRRCMDKSRDESKRCEQLVRSLERLQEVFNGSSMNAMRSRLEMIAKQQGMGFHVTEATCYLTADLFYLEVVLLPCGSVKEVKVAPHGGSPVSSEFLLQLLRSKHFADFSMKLKGLFNQYNIPGDNEIKLKLFASLQYLGKDLQEMAHLPSLSKDTESQMDLINNGVIGCLIPAKEDCPLTLQFYTSPADAMETSVPHAEPVVQVAQVFVGPSAVSHRLQMAPVMPMPLQLGPQGYPVFAPLSEAPHEAPHEPLPACYLLKLQPAIPVMMSFVNKISQITDVTVPDVGLQWAPFPKLLLRGSISANSHKGTFDEQDAVFAVPLPGDVMHSYVFPGAAWDVPARRGTVVDSVPFTHPGHVPALVELLRHQCTINALLRSCVCAHPGSACDQHFEVLVESDTSFSVTFHRPDTDSLAVLLVNVSSSHQITCRLFGAGTEKPSMDEYACSVMKRCMSVPLTLQALCSKLEETSSAPASADRSATTESRSDRPAPSSTTAAGTNTTAAAAAVTTSSQSAADAGSAQLAVAAARPEPLPEINVQPAADAYPFAPVGAFPHWMTNGGQMSELI